MTPNPDLLDRPALHQLVTATRLRTEAWVTLARWVLLAYCVAVLCPLRYWPIEDHFDNTWVFALNWAAAHGLKAGRDVFWTTGPLGYLTFPQDFGHNLALGLAFQCALWCVLIAILTDFLFVAKFPLANCAAFSVLLALASPLFWFNYVGLENLLIAGMLLLLSTCRWRGGRARLIAALAIAGVVPLIKISAGLIAAGAVLGFIVDRFFAIGRRAYSDLAVAVVVPVTTFTAGWWAAVGEPPSKRSLTVAFEIASGYSTAMSLPPAVVNLVLCFETVVLIALMIWWIARNTSHAAARFYAFLLVIPLWISTKHTFIRADRAHVLNYFCFAALAMGLIAIRLDFQKPRPSFLRMTVVLAIFTIMWQDAVLRTLPPMQALATVTGFRSLGFAAKAARGLDWVRRDLATASQDSPAELRLEPAIRAEIGTEAVASLSNEYNQAAAEGLNLKLLPIPQRYSAYSAYLDRLNADWIRDYGPRFFVWDGDTIDDRNLLTETPAQIAELIQWYSLKQLGERNLLLERRAQGRTLALEPLARRTVRLADGLELGESTGPVFLSMNCPLTITGRLRNLFLSVPGLFMALSGPEKGTPARVFPQLMGTPAFINYAPESLEDLAALFTGGDLPVASHATRLEFSGAGLGSYGPSCRFELFLPSAGTGN